MAGSISDIWNQYPHQGLLHSAYQAQSSATAGSTGDSGNSDSAGISANDFLTLLVTEMRNQDPTANTDPNEYINQLVQVNSLQQLISINQTLTADSASASPGKVSTPTRPQDQAPGAEPDHPPIGPTATSHQNVAVNPVLSKSVSGNLSIPAANAAAQSVAQALGGQINRQ